MAVRASEWHILILLLRLIYWAIYQHGQLQSSEAADEIATRRPVVHALVTGLACLSVGEKGKKKLQSVTINISSGLSENLCIGELPTWRVEAVHWKTPSSIIFLSTPLAYLWLSRH